MSKIRRIRWSDFPPDDGAAVSSGKTPRIVEVLYEGLSKIESEMAGASDRTFFGANSESGFHLNGNIQNIVRSSFPTRRENQFTHVDYWLENDDLIDSIVNTKAEFSIMGVDIRPANQSTKEVAEEDDDLRTLKQFLNRMQMKWDWPKIVEDLFKDWYAKDTMILYWKTEVNGDTPQLPPDARSKEELTPGLTEICTLNPADCDWHNSFGQDELWYKIPAPLLVKIKEATSEHSEAIKREKIRKLIEEGVEAKYIQAVIDGKDQVLLKKEDGDNWLICTRARKRHGLAKPSMCKIFFPLEIRKTLTEGEFAAAYMMKYFVMHAKTGESIESGPQAGSRANWAKPADIDALHAMLKDPGKATRLVTNHTVTFAFVFPPEEMWNKAKYETAEDRIYNWGGISKVLMSGTGGTNAGGYLGIRRLIANMRSARNKVSHLIFEFFDDPKIRKICNIPDDVDVRAVFDENALKEPRQLLDEIKFLMQSGAGDPQVALMELGRDPATIRDIKKTSLADQEKTGVWAPVYEIQTRSREGERQVSESGRGRPENVGTEVSEETRNQSPPALSS